MKNTKEMHALITVVYCINKTNGNEDKDITNLCRYIFLHCMNGNPNMLDILCIGKTKDEMLPYFSLEKDRDIREYLFDTYARKKGWKTKEDIPDSRVIEEYPLLNVLPKILTARKTSTVFCLSLIHI